MGGTSSRPAPKPDAEPRAVDPRYRTKGVRLLPGETITTGTDEEIVTILGSCVAACIRDPRTGFGGMNHFMLPESDTGEWNGASAAMRYGNYAMEALINAVLKSGCRRSDLEVKVFGGADLTAGPTRVGRQNAEFVLRYLDSEGLPVVVSDLGGPLGRRIHYAPSTGVVRRLLLRPTSDRAIMEDERRYADTLERRPVEGAIDLFD